MVLLEALIILISVILVYVAAVQWKFKYWRRKNLPYMEPKFPFGNLNNPLTQREYFGVTMKKIYNEFKSRGAKYGGIFLMARPSIMPIDPEAVKLIMQKDFQYFVDRGFYHNEKDDPLSAHLFAIGGQKWRNLRTKLTPTFTSGKMKMMFQTLINCSQQMEDYVNNFYESNSNDGIDIKNVLACFTTDIIGSCAFGLECNSFKSSDAEFRHHGRQVFAPRSRLRAIKSIFANSRPNLAQQLGIALIPKDTSAFFLKMVKDTVKYRESTNFVRKDMLQILMDLKADSTNKNTKHDGSVLTIEEIAAQAFVFFLAGFETSSTTMTYCLYELAKNPQIQEKVRREIFEVLEKHKNTISYEAIMDMKYMGQVIDETLRKYPPVTFITRECVKDYQLPDTDITVEKGTKVMISAMGLHHDPEFYPKPEKFDPERFSDENRHNIQPFTYIPFGEGPRICIGMRFGLMQTKVGLTVLLKNYIVSVNKNTPEPFEWDPFSFILTTKGGIWLDIEKVKK